MTSFDSVLVLFEILNAYVMPVQGFVNNVWKLKLIKSATEWMLAGMPAEANACWTPDLIWISHIVDIQLAFCFIHPVKDHDVTIKTSGERRVKKNKGE